MVEIPKENSKNSSPIFLRVLRRPFSACIIQILILFLVLLIQNEEALSESQFNSSEESKTQERLLLHKEIRLPIPGEIVQLELSENSKYLATIVRNKENNETILIYDTSNGKLIWRSDELPYASPQANSYFSIDGRYFAFRSSRGYTTVLSIYELPAMKPIATFECHGKHLQSEFSKNWRYFSVGCSSGNKEYEFSVYEFPSMIQKGEWFGVPIFSSNERYLAVLNQRKGCKLIDLEKNMELFVPECYQAFFPELEDYAVFYRRGIEESHKVLLVDLEKFEIVAKKEIWGKIREVSPDGRILFRSYDTHDYLVMETPSLRVIKKLDVVDEKVKTSFLDEGKIQFSPDGSLLFLTVGNRRIIYDFPSMRKKLDRLSLKPTHGKDWWTITKDSKYLIVNLSESLYIYELPTFKEVKRYDDVSHFSIDRKGRIVISRNRDITILDLGEMKEKSAKINWKVLDLDVSGNLLAIATRGRVLLSDLSETVEADTRPKSVELEKATETQEEGKNIDNKTESETGTEMEEDKEKEFEPPKEKEILVSQRDELGKEEGKRKMIPITIILLMTVLPTLTLLVLKRTRPRERKCPYCTREIEDNFRICPYCGNILREETERDEETKVY